VYQEESPLYRHEIPAGINASHGLAMGRVGFASAL